jgi:uncharacterized membrane protein YoaK (UPF0700 family)
VTSHDLQAKALAVALSALAGYVDAIGFVTLGGFFVSFMSGNSTRLGVGLVRHSPDAAVAAGLIATFVVGVTLGSLTGRIAGPYRRPVVLVVVALLLALAAGADAAGFGVVAIGAMVLAMGTENAVFEADGEVHIGLTYMTGTLVKIGQRVVTGLLGGDRLAWLPYLLLWIGLTLGAFAGASLYRLLGMGALWIAAGAAAMLAATSIPK